MKEEEALLREYDALRAEILAHQARREQVFLFTVTALGVVLGLALKTSGVTFVAVSLTPYFLIFHFCKVVSINSRHIITLGAYIRCFIAPHYEIALKWEDVWHRKAAGGSDEGAPKERFWKGRTYWHSFAVAASLVTFLGASILALLSKIHFNAGILGFSIFALVHLALCIITIGRGASKISWSKVNREKRAKQHEEMERAARTMLGGEPHTRTQTPDKEDREGGR